MIKLKEKPTSLKGLFACSGAKKIVLKNFQIKNVKLMEFMFLKCSSLTEFEASDIDNSNVTNMFESCNALTKINISSWDTTNVKKIGLMFTLCTGLKELNLINIDISKITDSENIKKFLYLAGTLEKCNYYEYMPDFSTLFYKDCYKNVLLCVWRTKPQ